MRKNTFFFIIGLIIFGFGCIYFTFEIMEYNFKDINLNKYDDFTVYTDKYVVDGTNYKFYSDGSINIINDDNVDNILVEFKYNSSILNIDKNDYIDSRDINRIYYDFDFKKNNNSVKNLFNIYKDGIKNKVMYNYDSIFNPSINIYVNSVNRKYIEISEYN
jgi:hypothetical protein